MSSSLAYWDSRWAQAPMAFATSWPDEFARRLELCYLATRLPKEGKVVEIGCGNFGLAEEPKLADMLRGRYIGIDGSAEAIKAAERRGGPGFEFKVQDLTKREALPLGDIVISKRVLQNLEPGPERQELLIRLREAYSHGIIIEDWDEARRETNMDRARLRREPLEIPAFNWPLTTEELFKARIHEFEPFMGYFYAITRVFPRLPRSGFEAAYTLSQAAILSGESQPLRGPVVAFRW